MEVVIARTSLVRKTSSVSETYNIGTWCTIEYSSGLIVCLIWSLNKNNWVT